MNAHLRIGLLCAVLTATLACGGGEESQPEGDASSAGDPYAGEPRLGRMYYTDIAKDQPPAIRLSVQFRRGGVARLIFQHGNSRAFREEKGRWHRDGGNVILELNPASSSQSDGTLPVGGSEFQQAELPSEIVFDIGPDKLATKISSLSDDYLHFQRSQRDRE